jgi:hypothetical protein
MEVQMDPHELQERQRLAEEGAEEVKRDLPRIRVEEPRSDGDNASPTDSAGALDEDRLVGMEPNVIKPTDAER